MTDREWRFKKRVRVEREILTTVNDAFSLSEPLVGLTDSAIRVWQKKVALAYGDACFHVVQSVQEASKRLSLDTDNSRDVFHDDNLMKESTIEGAVSLLKQDVQSFFALRLGV